MFSYLRIFFVLSLLVVIVIAVLSGMSFRSVALVDVTQMVERNSASLADGYINEVWKKYRDDVTNLTPENAASAKDNPRIMQFAQETVHYFQHMPFLRINIYNNKGLLLISSNNTGSNGKLARPVPSPDSNFVAKNLNQPHISSNLLEDVVLKGGDGAAVVQTLIPIHVDGNKNDGAVEVVYDMSTPWTKLSDFQIYGTLAIIVLFVVFLVVLFLVSRRAESIIAKQYETNMELAATAAAAQAENQNKSQFLANISHELRTPLNAIIGFSDIIKNEAMANIKEKKYHDYINDIHSSGVHLLSLINDILDYSKAEAGKLELEVSEVNTTKLIQNCMRLVSPRAEAGNVYLVEELPKEQIIMLADGKKVKQVFLNLLSNAVKFTPAEGQVRVSAWRNVADDTYSFEVSDTGIGIAPKDISVAMSPFGQVDNKHSRKYEGTGLGLPLTKKFVELMGGKFSIESKVGSGTTVTFVLPREVKEREGVIIKQVA